MISISRRSLSGAALSLLLATVPAQSEVIVDTLSSTTTSSGGLVTSTKWGSAEFVTDGAVYALDSVTVRLVEPLDSSSPIIVAIFDDAAGDPGAQLILLNGEPNPGEGDFTYTPVVPFELAASTAYHLVLRSSGSSIYVWESSLGGTFTATGTGTALEERESTLDAGSSWTNIPGHGMLYRVEGSIFLFRDGFESGDTDGWSITVP